jgi:cell division protein FtsA
MKAIPSLVRGQGRFLPNMGPQIVAAVDVGSSKTACLIAEWSPGKKSVDIDTRNGLKILGFGQTVSRGVKAGSIADVAETEKSIRIAVDAAERMAKTTIKSVHVNISGGKPSTLLATAATHTETGVVSQSDIEAVVSSAVTQAEIGKRQVLHLLPVAHVLDDVESTQPPIGMHGNVLAADVAVVTMESAALNNLRMAIERSHLQVSGMALTPYASARAVLAQDELDLGTVLLDIGGSTTSIAVFRRGRLVASAVVPLGGSHVTNDIAHGLSTTVVHAERLKTLFGTVLANGHDERELLAVPLLGERGVDTVQKVPKHVLTSIIVPRLDEIFEHVRVLLADNAMASVHTSRVVITGGSSQLHGMREFATARLGLPVRIGLPASFSGLPELARSGGFAAVAGLLVCASEPDLAYDMPQEAKLAIDRRQMTYAKRVGKWLAEAF